VNNSARQKGYVMIKLDGGTLHPPTHDPNNKVFSFNPAIKTDLKTFDTSFLSRKLDTLFDSFSNGQSKRPAVVTGFGDGHQN
jgi:hypothetical protein